MKRTPRGFTLVELMIAMSLGLLLVGAAFQAYMAISSANRIREAISLQTENALFVGSYLSRHVRAAGQGLPGTAVAGDAQSLIVGYRHDTSEDMVDPGIDCLGRPLNAGTPEATDLFFIEDGFLVCESSVDGAQTIERVVGGIESMTVSYRFSRDDHLLFHPTPPEDVAEWGSVDAVRFTVAMASTHNDVPVKSITMTAAIRSRLTL